LGIASSTAQALPTSSPTPPPASQGPGIASSTAQATA
jgi:hypothetical protein